MSRPTDRNAYSIDAYKKRKKRDPNRNEACFFKTAFDFESVFRSGLIDMQSIDEWHSKQ